MSIRNHEVLVLTADGQPHAWMSVEDAICAKVKNLISFEIGDDDTVVGGTSRISGERSTIDVKNIIALKGKFKYSNRIPPLTNQNLFIRDLHTCGYCGRFVHDDKLTRDHIIPVSKGGKDIWTNVVSSCKKCNNLKDNNLLKDTDFELIWIPYVPVKAEHLIMKNRRILADQAEFVLGFVPEHSRMFKYIENKFNQ